MIDSLFVSEFKQFEELYLTDLKRINIISGQNNIGKTSVLEAIFMFYDRGAPDFTLKQFGWRGVNSVNMDPVSLWQPIFNDFDLSKKIIIRVNDSGHEETALFEHDDNYAQVISSNQARRENNVQLSSRVNSQSLKITYKYSNRATGQSTLSINNGQLSLSNKDVRQPNKTATFVSSSTRGMGFYEAERLGLIDIDEGLDHIVNALKIIEPRLKNLSIVPNQNQPLIYGDVGLSKKIPIAYMGEGVSKLLSILVTLATTKRGIVLLDEIENGIHYSLFPKVWEVIENMAERYNCQLFVTTHSNDVLQGLKEYHEKSDSQNISFTRLDRKGNKVIAKQYSRSMLFTALERLWEVR